MNVSNNSYYNTRTVNQSLLTSQTKTPGQHFPSGHRRHESGSSSNQRTSPTPGMTSNPNFSNQKPNSPTRPVLCDPDVSIYEHILSNLRLSPISKNSKDPLSKKIQNSSGCHGVVLQNPMAGHPHPPNPTLPKKTKSKTNYQYGLIENALGELSIEDIELSTSKKNVYYGNSVKLRDEHIISTVEDTCYIFSSELGGYVKKKPPT
jgi:hypothetical protein